ncbi:MAG: hypothetical protein ACREMG_06280 [Gemmatimonadales bacterium]
MNARAFLAAALVAATPISAQTPAADPSSRLREVLPAEVADHVLQRMAEARATGLPAEALAHRALELAAKGVGPDLIPVAIDRQAAALQAGRDALVEGGREAPTGDEITAAATALGKGVDGSAVSELARSTPSGRSLAVPLYTISSLLDRGLPSDDALAAVFARLSARAAVREARGHGRPAAVPTRGNGQDRPDPPGKPRRP